MEAIRFEPTIGADFAIDRRQSGHAGDMFADMLGEQLKKRGESERTETLARRRSPAERRQGADPQPAQGRPIRPVIKHPHTLRGEAKTVAEEQPQLADRKEAADASMDAEQPETAVAPADQASAVAEPDATEAKPAEAVVSDAAPTEDPATEEAPATATVALVPAEGVTGPIAAEAGLAEGMAEDAATPESIAPAEAATPQPAEGEAAAASEAAAPTAAGFAAGFAAALAASQADTAAAALGDGMDAAPAEAQTLNAAGLPVVPDAAADLTANAAAEAALETMPEETAETAALTMKLTPEAPRPSEPAKSRPAPAAAQAEIRAQATVATPAPQAPAAAVPPSSTETAAIGNSADSSFDAGLFDGDGNGMPGWTLHLAQGAAARRPDFVAQLRQHLQDLPAHEQVAVNIQRALREGTGRLSIQLSPAELGKIHVRLDIDEEKRVSAAVTVEKPGTLELLQRDVKALERALHDAGLKMEGSDLSFSLGRQDGKEFSQDTGGSGHPAFGAGQADEQVEAEAQAGMAAQVDTAAGVVNLEV